MAARWRAALADYGVTPDEGRAAEAAGRVNGSLVRDRVLTALDLWLAADPSAGVRAVLRAADPDPYRDAVRDAVAASDRQAVGRPGRAAGGPGPAGPVRGRPRPLPGVPADRRRAVLEGRPPCPARDLALLMALGLVLTRDRPEGAGERVRWFQAAVAAHPGNLAAL